MRDHPIPPVTEPFQYRAIGMVRGVYHPETSDKFTRGVLVDVDGIEIEAVVLGRVITLMRRHLAIESPHFWVVYPRSREINHLHLQIAGIWEPSTLDKPSHKLNHQTKIKSALDQIAEGDDYFSIRGELIYTKPEKDELVVKIRQRPKSDVKKTLPFKLQLKGNVPLECLRNFVSLDVRRVGQQLVVEGHDVIGPMPTRGGRKNSKSSSLKR